MSDNTVRLRIKVDDGGSFKTVEANADDLRKALGQVKTEADGLNSKLVNRSSLANIYGWVTTAVRGLSRVMGGATEAYRVQAAAETRLSQVMRNTMGATDDEIQGIKNLAAEQQKLGVVGDEVILTGAQELATYMSKKESLEALIPVMADMIAQQYEYGATGQSAVSVAQMMGKVFEGETGALKRLGYSFTEAQGKVLKYGTEQQKVKTLAEVITPIVENMNAALADTPEGRLKQAEMRLGDIKEQAGGIINSIKVAALPALNVVLELLEKIAAKAQGVANRIAASPVAQKAADAMRMILAELEGLTGKIYSVLGPVVSVLVNAAGHFKTILDGTWRVITEKVHPALEKVTQAIARIVAGVVDWITSSETTMDIFRQGWAIISVISDVIAFIVGLIEKIINYGLIPILKIIDTIYKVQKEAWAYVFGKISEGIGRVLGKIRQGIDWIRGIGERAGAWFDKNMHPVVEWFTRLKTFVRGIVQSVKDWLADMVNPLIRFWNSISGRRVELVGGKLPKETGTDEPQRTETPTPPTPEPEHPEYDEKETKKKYKKESEAAEKKTRLREVEIKESYAKGDITDPYDYERKLSENTIAGLERQVEIALKYKQDESKFLQQIADTRLQMAKDEYDHENNLIKQKLTERKTLLTDQLNANLITEKEHKGLVSEAEAEAIEEQLKLDQKYKKDTTQIELDLAEARQRLKSESYDAQIDALDQHLNLMKAALAEQLADDLITQQRHDSLMLEEMVRYWRKRLSLAETYGDQEEVAEARQQFAQAKTDQKNDSRNREEEQLQRPGKAIGNIGQAWNGIKGVGDSFRDLASAITETDNAWDALTRTVDAFISIFQSVMQVVETINTITKAIEAARKEKETETAVTVAGNAAEAASEQALATSSVTAAAEQAAANAVLSTSNTAAAATGAASAVASIPYVGPALALTWAATIEAALSAIPKFASGAIVYGPTLGLMGEYGGASSNPEVIAPLSRLRSLLGDSGSQGRSEVKFRIEGRELVGILNKQNNIYQRSK